MDIGIFVFESDSSLDPAVLARRADELGFESFWVPEHPVIPLQTSSPYPSSPDGIIPDVYLAPPMVEVPSHDLGFLV